MQLILTWIRARLLYLKMGALVASWLIVAWTTHHLDKQAEAARSAVVLKKAAEELAKDQANSDGVGSDIEKKLAKFKTETRGIADANIDVQCYFSPQWVLTVGAAINSGNAARQRAGTVPNAR